MAQVWGLEPATLRLKDILYNILNALSLWNYVDQTSAVRSLKDQNWTPKKLKNYLVLIWSYIIGLRVGTRGDFIDSIDIVGLGHRV